MLTSLRKRFPLLLNSAFFYIAGVVSARTASMLIKVAILLILTAIILLVAIQWSRFKRRRECRSLSVKNVDA